MFAPLRSKFTSVLTSRFHAPHTSKRAFFWKKNKPSPFYIARAHPQEKCPILELMWRYYYPEEPTTVALGLGHTYNKLFDERVLKVLGEGLSYVARCRYTGDVIGCCINRTLCVWDADLTDELACTIPCKKTRQLYQFYAYLIRTPCLFERYCTNKVFEISQLVVKKADRGKGIGELLIQASRTLGADCGYKVIRVDATSLYTARICEKLKMEMIYEIPYCSYTANDTPEHEPIFKPPPPHCACKIFIDAPFVDTS